MRLVGQKSKENDLHLWKRNEAFGVRKSFSAHNSIHHVFHRFEFFISIEVTTFIFSLRKLILDRVKLLLI